MSDYVNKKDSIVNVLIAAKISKSNTLLQANANLLRSRVGQEYARMVLNTSNRALNSSLDKEVRRMLKGVKNNPITININGRNYDYAKYTKNAVRNTIKEIAQESALGRLQEMGGDFIIFSLPITLVLIFRVIFNHHMQNMAHWERNFCRAE